MLVRQFWPLSGLAEPEKKKPKSTCWTSVWGEPGENRGRTGENRGRTGGTGGEPGENRGRTGGTKKQPKVAGRTGGVVGRTGGEPGAFAIHLHREPGENRGLESKKRGRTGGGVLRTGGFFPKKNAAQKGPNRRTLVQLVLLVNLIGSGQLQSPAKGFFENDPKWSDKAPNSLVCFSSLVPITQQGSVEPCPDGFASERLSQRRSERALTTNHLLQKKRAVASPSAEMRGSSFFNHAAFL